MKKIPLSKGKFAIIDDLDFEYINQWKWCISFYGYAVRNSFDKKGKRTMFYMHRELIKPTDGQLIDHKNRNRLDNRRSNLRTCTFSQNFMNTGLRKDNVSGYKGIMWDKSRNKWRAWINIDKKQIQLGRYTSLRAAWLARRWGERVYFREFAGEINGY